MYFSEAFAEPAVATLADRGDPICESTATRAPIAVRFELITTRAGFDALEGEWNALFERAGRGIHVFQTFNWNWHWANHFLASGSDDEAPVEFAIVAGWRNGRLTTVWPLAKQKVRGITQVFWMSEPIGQYGDALVDDVHDADAILRAGWDFLNANIAADLVRLRRVRADAGIAPLLAASGAVVAERQVAPFIDLTTAKSFAEYEKRYSARSRRNRGRLARRLAEQGQVAMTRHAGGPEARALAIRALEMKAEWLKERGLVSSAITDPRTTSFFADAAEGRGRSAECVVFALTIDGEPAALEVSFVCKGRLAMHVIVFNLKYEKSGVGVLRLEQSLRDGFNDGLQFYDMLAPGDSYKLDWADGAIEVVDYAKPLTLAGQAYSRLYLGFVRQRAKDALKAMPPSLRRVLTGRSASAAA